MAPDAPASRLAPLGCGVSDRESGRGARSVGSASPTASGLAVRWAARVCKVGIPSAAPSVPIVLSRKMRNVFVAELVTMPFT